MLSVTVYLRYPVGLQSPPCPNLPRFRLVFLCFSIFPPHFFYSLTSYYNIKLFLLIYFNYSRVSEFSRFNCVCSLASSLVRVSRFFEARYMNGIKVCLSDLVYVNDAARRCGFLCDSNRFGSGGLSRWSFSCLQYSDTYSLFSSRAVYVNSRYQWHIPAACLYYHRHILVYISTLQSCIITGTWQSC